MKIVIIGDGKVGYELTRQLAREGHDIVVIDNNPQALKNPVNLLDVMGIRGNGASYAVQMEAGVPKADLLIAATSMDEINILCCLLARKLGAKRTIARVRNPEYAEELIMMQEELGLSLTVNPEQAAAFEISRILRFPQALKMETFARGKVEIVEHRILAGSPLINLPLAELYRKFRVHILVCAVQRGERVIIPDGNTVLRAEDKINITGAPDALAEFFRVIGVAGKTVHSVMIVGGGRIAYYLAKMSVEIGMRVKIIEKDPERCEVLCAAVPKASIVQGDGSDQELLHEEGLSNMDAFVALTGMDEENIVLAMYARMQNVGKIIAKVDRLAFPDVLGGTGVESVISPKTLVTNQIVRYVRALENSWDSNNVETLSRIVGGQVEALEFRITQKAPYLGVKLSQLKLKPHLLVACIVRDGRIIIPNGDDALSLGDRVIVVTTNPNMRDLSGILLSQAEELV